jgi:hypothetical protein
VVPCTLLNTVKFNIDHQMILRIQFSLLGETFFDFLSWSL